VNEYKLYRILKNIVPDLERSRNKYCGYDCYSKKHKAIVELKCRPIHYDDLIMEKHKYDKLIVHKDKAKIYYVNQTPKGIYSFNINNLKPKWVKGKYKKTTEFKDNRKVEKIVTLLNINQAKKLL
jgi:hypothetical protein